MPKSNSWEDEDFARVIEQHEKLDAEAESVMAEARGRVNGLRTRQKNLKKEAVDDLGIPRSILNATLKTRVLEKKIDKLAKSLNDDDVELFEDAVGQFSFLKPSKEQTGKTGAQVAAERAKEAANARDEAELKEGEKILEDAMAGIQ